MPDIYIIVNDIRRAFIDEHNNVQTLMYNLWFEWHEIIPY